MKSMIIVALALVAVAVALPVDEQNAKIVSETYEQDPEGSFRSSFQTDNGINQQQEGQLKEVLDEENKPHTVLVLRGSYSYPGEDGKPVIVTYQADENGYVAEGDSVPKPARR